jgi:transposase
MRQVKEVLRLRFELGLAHREIALAVGLGKTAVSDYVARAERAGLSWRDAKDLPEREIEERLFRQLDRHEPAKRSPIELEWVHREMRRPGVTLYLLWEEYAAAARARNDGLRPYQYSQFCDAYSRYRRAHSPTMRQVHRAGEKVFVDFSGKRPHIVDPKTGEFIEVELYVAVLGASNYTYAEATRSQKLSDFVGATARTFEYYGAVSAVLVSDQLRSAVKVPCRYEPEINATFAEMGKHYGCAIIPARPRKPRDKAKVEVGVQIAQRWILACLRHRTFFSLDEINIAIWELLEKLNRRPFAKGLDGCRHSLFETIDRPAMKPLPPIRYEMSEWKFDVGVGLDYCIVFDDRRYSVPCALIQQRVDVRATATTIEVLHNTQRVALHVRSYAAKGRPILADEHRPRSHREYGNWPPDRLMRWAESIGPHVGTLVATMLRTEPYPELRYRSCLGVLRLGKTYGAVRLDAACARAMALGATSYRTVAEMLKRRLENVPLPDAPSNSSDGAAARAPRTVIDADLVRGSDYFDKEETNDD